MIDNYYKKLVLSCCILFFSFSAVASAAVISTYSGTTNDQTQIFGATGTYQRSAQFFTASSDYEVTSATVQLQAVGSFSDFYVYDIYTDAAGAPGTYLATSNIVATQSDITGSCKDVTLTFSSPVITAGNYWVVISRTGSRNTSNYAQLCDVYPSGSGWLVEDSGTWHSPGVTGLGSTIYTVNGDLHTSGGGPPATTTPAATSTPMHWETFTSMTYAIEVAMALTFAIVVIKNVVT
jgi:hypothetical protein